MPNTRKNPRDADSPFVTREGLANGISFRERFPGVDPKDVKVVCVPEQNGDSHGRRGARAPRTSVPLASDVVTELQAMGPKWPELADKILRAGLKKLKQKAA